MEIASVAAHKTLGLENPRVHLLLVTQRHQSSARIYTTPLITEQINVALHWASRQPI